MMTEEEQGIPRFVLEPSAMKLSAALGIKYAADGGHWEIVRADGERTEEFLAYYETSASLTDDDKFALMALTIASFDDWALSAPDDHPLRERLRRRLLADFDIHESTIHYWCSWDVTDPDPDYIFRITPYMREIWSTQRASPDAISPAYFSRAHLQG